MNDNLPNIIFDSVANGAPIGKQSIRFSCIENQSDRSIHQALNPFAQHDTVSPALIEFNYELHLLCSSTPPSPLQPSNPSHQKFSSPTHTLSQTFASHLASCWFWATSPQPNTDPFRVCHIHTHTHAQTHAHSREHSNKKYTRMTLFPVDFFVLFVFSCNAHSHMNCVQDSAYSRITFKIQRESGRVQARQRKRERDRRRAVRGVWAW